MIEKFCIDLQACYQKLDATLQLEVAVERYHIKNILSQEIKNKARYDWMCQNKVMLRDISEFQKTLN